MFFQKITFFFGAAAVTWEASFETTVGPTEEACIGSVTEGETIAGTGDIGWIAETVESEEKSFFFSWDKFIDKSEETSPGRDVVNFCACACDDTDQEGLYIIYKRLNLFKIIHKKYHLSNKSTKNL